jgi:hypothetical protein
MRWPAVLEGEYMVAWVIVGAEEFSLNVLPVAPSAERGEGGPINRDRLNRDLAARRWCLVEGLAHNPHNPIHIDRRKGLKRLVHYERRCGRAVSVPPGNSADPRLIMSERLRATKVTRIRVVMSRTAATGPSP